MKISEKDREMIEKAVVQGFVSFFKLKGWSKEKIQEAQTALKKFRKFLRKLEKEAEKEFAKEQEAKSQKTDKRKTKK